MPTYQYRCESCGEELEKMQKLADAPLTDCPACGQPALRKVISAVGFRLKGGGWYETDFKTGDKKKNLHESGDKSKSESGSGESKPAESKTETAKPKESAAKPDAKPAESKPAAKSDAA
jgi:putative FmdB family regulatory protein